MKLFIQDCGWKGAIIVIAENEEDALVMMKEYDDYALTGSIEEYDIVPGAVCVAGGDR